MEKVTSSTHLILTIFGVTGDLYRTKLARALYSLYLEDLLPEHFTIVGFARRPFTDDAFRELTKEALPKEGDSERVVSFLEHFTYIQGDLENAQDFQALGKLLGEKDHEEGSCSDKLFYLATQPSLYETIFKNIAAAGLTIPCAPGTATKESNWTRVLVEKPFGEDFAKAKQLDKLLSELFDESQIFRIDHYLAKETVQNILTFRFSNTVFESLWNSHAIEQVRIIFHENKTITSRGGFYEGVGALRDVGQNHMLQMLAILAMEKPAELSAEAIRTQRAVVLEKVVLLKQSSGGQLVRAQYQGYLQESQVAGDSETETFFRVALGIENERWSEVPFVLESGKALSEAKVALEVYFKGTTPCHCPVLHTEGHQNILTFDVQPNEGIRFKFWFKHPGFDSAVEPQELSFNYARDAKDEPLHDAYERVLYDGIQGDQTLFTNTQEIMAEWRIVGEILAAWQSVPLVTYEQGATAKTIGA